MGVPSLLAIVLPREEEYWLYSREPRKQDKSELKARLHKDYPKVWAEDNPPRRAKKQTPVILELKPEARPHRV